MDKESPQVIDSSEGELPDSKNEGPDSGTPELDQLVLTVEEQMDYDSFVLASPTATSASLWKFADKNHSSSQTQPQAQTTNIQAQPITSTPLKPSGS